MKVRIITTTGKEVELNIVSLQDITIENENGRYISVPQASFERDYKECVSYLIENIELNNLVEMTSDEYSGLCINWKEELYEK